MKNLDVFSRRVLILALSLTMVLCSASLFIRSINSASAAPLPVSANNVKVIPDDVGAGCCGIGISNGNAYFIKYFHDGRYYLSMSPLAGFQNYDAK